MLSPFFHIPVQSVRRVQRPAWRDRSEAALVANHSGQLPWDGTMLMAAVLSEHPAQRLVRTLYAEWFAQIPFLATWLVRMGQAPATVENGARLLGQEELVAVFPEGQKGAGKAVKERYQLGRFGREGFQMALSTGAPIIPVSVVSAEDLPRLTESSTLARLTGVPHFPITPTFLAGAAGPGAIAHRWTIDFGRPIESVLRSRCGGQSGARRTAH
jgi:1-acyl-sn-glycerol-3-phosphate acyltransferase